MNIDRNNCEAYFLDFYEGRLSDEETKALFGFLDQHPELKSDFEEYGSIPDSEVLLSVPENGSMEFAGSPKKQTSDDDLIALLEGQLGDVDRKALEEELERNTMLASQFALYKKTISQPDLQIQYPNKKHLKKGAPVIPLLLRYGAVAAMLSGVFLSVWVYQNRGPDENLTVLNSPDEIPNVKSESSESRSPIPSGTINTTDYPDVLTTEEASVSNPPSSVIASADPKSGGVQSTGTGSSQPPPSSGPSDVVQRNEFESMVALEPIHVSALPAPSIDKEPREIRLPDNGTDMTTADLHEPIEAVTGPSAETLFGTFLSEMGGSVVDRIKSATDEKVVVGKEDQEDSDVVTSTFKLGAFEIYRSRTKK